VGWRRATRAEREPATQGPTSNSRSGGSGKRSVSGNGGRATLNATHWNQKLANAVDNFRSLQPRTYSYEIQLPTQQQLQALGVTLQGRCTCTRKSISNIYPRCSRDISLAGGRSGAHDLFCFFGWKTAMHGCWRSYSRPSLRPGICQPNLPHEVLTSDSV
jgi:hypothetical protein